MSGRKERQLWDALPDVLTALIDKAAALAGIAFASTLAYLIYGLFSGYVRGFPQLATHAQRARVLSNLETAANVFLIAGIFLIMYLLLRLWEVEQLAVGLGAAGAVFYFGGPYLLTQVFGGWIQSNRAALTIQGAFVGIGQILLVTAVVRIVPALIEELRRGFKGVGQESVTRRAGRAQNPGVVHPFSACWRLPYCQLYVRDKCPRFRERKTCWRKEKGCLCDDSIIASALMGGEKTSAGAREALILEYLPGAGGRPTRGRRLQCKNCFIFLEHQRIKHGWVAPLTVPLVLGVFWLSWGAIERGYQLLGAWVAAMVQRAALGEVDTTALRHTFTNEWMMWLVVICIGLYVLTGLLQLMEWVFFKLKL